jgi:hypothetical protein
LQSLQPNPLIGFISSIVVNASAQRCSRRTGEWLYRALLIRTVVNKYSEKLRGRQNAAFQL